MRTLKAKYNNKQRDMLNKTIMEREKWFLMRIIGFGFI